VGCSKIKYQILNGWAKIDIGGVFIFNIAHQSLLGWQHADSMPVSHHSANSVKIAVSKRRSTPQIGLDRVAVKFGMGGDDKQGFFYMALSAAMATDSLEPCY
jgi:hypothetical protein